MVAWQNTPPSIIDARMSTQIDSINRLYCSRDEGDGGILCEGKLDCHCHIATDVMVNMVNGRCYYSIVFQVSDSR